jgi:transposase
VRRRNEKLARLRKVVRKNLAIVAVDLADRRQAAVVTDHDSAVLGRRMFSGSAWVIDEIVDWALPIAQAAGFRGVVVACEPTGHRWKPIYERCRARHIGLVCVQPMLVHRSREGENYTKSRSDYGDAVIIARLTAELRCYLPYAPEGPWARLRHLGSRRNRLITRASAARQATKDLLGCVWPAVLETAAQPADSLTWRAAVSVSADPDQIRAMGYDAFAQAVTDELPRWGGKRLTRRICEAVFAATKAPGGVEWDRIAAAERVGFLIADWRRALAELAEVEARMVALLEELHLRHLVETVAGLSAIGAAQILSETGDPGRYDCPRTWVKHAGVCPMANESGRFRGQTKVSGRGRPGLRTAGWRAVMGALRHNRVYQDRYGYLTTRSTNRLKDAQARTALVAGLLRQLYVVVTRQVAWDPAIAAGLEKEAPAA